MQKTPMQKTMTAEFIVRLEEPAIRRFSHMQTHVGLLSSLAVLLVYCFKTECNKLQWLGPQQGLRENYLFAAIHHFVH